LFLNFKLFLEKKLIYVSDRAYLSQLMLHWSKMNNPYAASAMSMNPLLATYLAMSAAAGAQQTGLQPTVQPQPQPSNSQSPKGAVQASSVTSSNTTSASNSAGETRKIVGR